MSVPTIQKRLDEARPPRPLRNQGQVKRDEPAVVVIDTVYLFGRSWGVMIARNAHEHKTIDRMYVMTETIEHFMTLVKRIQLQGVLIGALVVDGRPGMLKCYPDIPTQMCQFHQIQIVTRYVTNRPKLEAGRQLRRIALAIPRVDKAMYVTLLTKWKNVWGAFIQEKTINEQTGRWEYTHRRIRSAYYSMWRNTPHLFIYKEPQHLHLNIPNTTNSLDGSFAHLKDSLRVHRGLKRRRKMRLIESLIWR